MAYFAAKADLVTRLGSDNLARLADPDGSGTTAIQDAAIEVALERADAWIRGHLRKSLYSHSLPDIVDRDGNVPEDLTYIAVLWATWTLSLAHGIFSASGKPVSHYTDDKQEAEQLMEKIRAGEVYLLDCEA
jgi:hypothetical protein